MKIKNMTIWPHVAALVLSDVASEKKPLVLGNLVGEISPVDGLLLASIVQNPSSGS